MLVGGDGGFIDAGFRVSSLLDTKVHTHWLPRTKNSTISYVIARPPSLPIVGV